MGNQSTDLIPAALAVLLVMVSLTWVLPRRLAFCPLLFLTCIMPLGQELIIAGLHFTIFRLVMLVGIVRVLVRGEFAQLTWMPLDKVFAWWVVVSVIFGTLSNPSVSLLVNRLGAAYNAICSYYFFRCLIVDFEDVVTSVRTLLLASLPLAVAMLYESSTGHNPFAIFGGVTLVDIFRDGHIRCQGPFRNWILAGTFGATLIPLCVALWQYRPQSRRLVAAGLLASIVITITARSSGALIAMVAGVGGLMFWKWRRYLRLVRRGFVVAIIGLALVMNAPVWYLIAKLSNITGGGGWHRAYLISQAVDHFGQWWLFGTTYTANWGPAGEVIASNPNMMDITNQYIMEGVNGGVLKLLLFVIIIFICFRGIGRRLRAEGAESPTAFFVWALGATLFAHCLSFISVTYFDQIIIIWYWLLAAMALVIYSPGSSYLAVDMAAQGDGEPDLSRGADVCESGNPAS